MIFLAIKCPSPTEKNPIKTWENEFKKNSLYLPWLNKSNKCKDHPLKEVNDPQNPNPNINLYLWEIGKELIKPNKKQPIIFTIKIWLICHRHIAAGTDPIMIKIKLLFFKL